MLELACFLFEIGLRFFKKSLLMLDWATHCFVLISWSKSTIWPRFIAALKSFWNVLNRKFSWFESSVFVGGVLLWFSAVADRISFPLIVCFYVGCFFVLASEAFTILPSTVAEKCWLSSFDPISVRRPIFSLCFAHHYGRMYVIVFQRCGKV